MAQSLYAHIGDAWHKPSDAKGELDWERKIAWRKEDEIGVNFVKAVDTAKIIQAERRARLLQTPCP